MQTYESEFDVIIIGGGTSGLMAAIAARTVGANTLLVEKGHKLGCKLGISGGGRCNVTNAKALPELMQNILGNSRFLHSALNRFSNMDIMEFFQNMGIQLKEEDHGRVFPVSDKAATVVKALVDKVFALGVEVRQDTPVKRLLANGNGISGVLLYNDLPISASAVVVATGGCSVPRTGSTGDAYPWAKSLGHTIINPFPTEVPLTSNEWFIYERTLQGLSLRDIEMTVWNNAGKKLTTEQGDMIFTHFGLSGPVSLRCSHYVSTSLRKNPQDELTITLDCTPEIQQDKIAETLDKIRNTDKRKHLNNVLTTWLPERLTNVILSMANIDGTIQMANISNRSILQLASIIKTFPIRVTGTLPLAQATITGGGVSIKEIDPKSLGSKICTGLYFAGEVMDVHAHTGGYNITVAFSTGHLAGTSAAMFALEKAKKSDVSPSQ